MPAEGGTLLHEARASNVDRSLKTNVHFGLRFSFIPPSWKSGKISFFYLCSQTFTLTLSSALFAPGLNDLSLLGPMNDNRVQIRSMKRERTSKVSITVLLTSVGHAKINALYICG